MNEYTKRGIYFLAKDETENINGVKYYYIKIL